MKTLILSVLMASAFALAALPTAEATAFCTDAAERLDLGESDCRAFFCFKHFCSSDLNPVCVTEPCPGPFP